ncbi:6-hydroxymethylpterin diphosphokinase MptE-like protein [Thiolinea disciformis]|uniref:6-hydroxymethylpterin diphosphokinase MptE-like protein n=1 Tax=Thiolinea disciformis TaxID=125614 RepID=UPI0003699209|nr:6-hydroxymethylpterin diphosphokinase MptE-like protein [Thiolinea disciformis]
MSIKKLWFKLTHSPKKWHYLEYWPELRLERQQQSETLIFQNNLKISSRNVDELKALFTAQTVFLVGAGPSINEQNLAPLKSSQTLFLNGALSLLESHQLKPSAVLIIDKGFIQRHQHFLRLIPVGTPCIFTLGVVRQILRFEPEFFEARPLYLIEKASKPYGRPALTTAQLDAHYFAKSEDVACSLDIKKGFAEAGTVMYVAAQLMLYWRAQTIILVGFDLGNAQQPRFYETQQSRAKNKSGLEKALHARILPAFTLFKKLCDERGIQLTNASHLSQMPYDIIPFNPVLLPQNGAMNTSSSQVSE